MQTQTALPNSETSPMSYLLRWWRSWTGNRAGRAELDRLSTSEVSSIARDTGTTSIELRSLAGKWPDSADLLWRRLNLLKIDATELKQTQPATTRDLSKTCALCRDNARCRRDLDTATADPGWRKYCPNSSTLLAMVSARMRNQTSGNKG